jgi:molecular chaperone GrpE
MTEEQGDVVEISYVPDDEDDEPETPPKRQKSHKNGVKKKGTPPAFKKLQKKLEEQQEIIEKVVKERDEFKDKYLRSLAEVDNFRKRVNKEKEEFRKYVLGDFILGLLEVVDNLERAIKAKANAGKNAADTVPTAGEDEKSIVSGVEMIYRQLMDLLRKNKVEEIDALGKLFDPNLHQALSKDEREGITEPVVLEVYQRGFTYNEKLLRPALVKVAMPLEAKKEPEKSSTESEDDTGE